MGYGDFAKSYLGFALGWLAHPTLWLLGGPFRWLSLLIATEQQESGLNPGAFNPERTGSAGLLQFQTTTWNQVAPSAWAKATSAFTSSDPRRDPGKQGYVGAAYIAYAVGADYRWLLIALPIIGPIYLRALWRYGVGGFTAGRGALGLLSEEWAYTSANEMRFLQWFYGSRIITIIPLIVALMTRRKRGM